MATKPSAARSKTTSKTEAKAEAPAPEAPEAEAKKAVTFRIKELVELVAPKSKVKKRDLRDVAEAVLAELGAAIDRGDGINLPGLGHVRVARKAEGGAMTLRLRRPDPNAAPKAPKEKAAKGGEGAKEALAAADEAE